MPVLYGQRYGEIVGVEMPGEPSALLDDVNDDIGQWIGVTKKPVRTKRTLYEQLERVKFIDGTKTRFWPKIVGGNKGIGTIIKATTRIRCREIGIIFREVGVRPVKGPVRSWRHQISLPDKIGQSLPPDEAFQYTASVVGKLRRGIGDDLRVPGRPWPVQWIPIEVDIV